LCHAHRSKIRETPRIEESSRGEIEQRTGLLRCYNENHRAFALTPRFTQAVEYARQVQIGWRKGTQVPYMAHLLVPILYAGR
jgi:hypothetical protein